LTIVMPAWAVFCGAMASGELGGDPQGGFRMLLAVVVMDPLMGAFRSGWDRLSWPRGGLGDGGRRGPVVVPWAEPGSPGFMAQRGMNAVLEWLAERFWPAAGRQAVGLALVAALTAAIAMSLGPGSLAVVVAAWALVALMRRLGRHAGGWAGHAGLGLLAVALPWAAGQVALDGLTWRSVAMAGLGAGAFVGWRAGGQGHRSGLWALLLAQLAMIAVAAALRRPLEAWLIGMALLPQALLGTSEAGERVTARGIEIAMMVALLFAAIAAS